MRLISHHHDSFHACVRCPSLCQALYWLPKTQPPGSDGVWRRSSQPHVTDGRSEARREPRSQPVTLRGGAGMGTPAVRPLSLHSTGSQKNHPRVLHHRPRAPRNQERGTSPQEPDLAAPVLGEQNNPCPWARPRDAGPAWGFEAAVHTVSLSP